jgi:hypothetical protein
MLSYSDNCIVIPLWSCAFHAFKNTSQGTEWWYVPVIPALGRWRRDDGELQASLGYAETLS